jgi:hypothetical protein
VQVYFDNRAQGSFAPGPIWDGGITRLHDGVTGCATSPAGFEIWATDQWGNIPSGTEVSVDTDATGTVVFTDADPGFIVSQAGTGATINTGPFNTTRAWFSNTLSETVTVTLLTGSGSDPTIVVDFEDATADETGLCGDMMNNDCDQFADCVDPECAGDPACCNDSDILLSEVFGGSPDYIEVINTCSVPWDIGGLTIRADSLTAGGSYTFPANTIVPAGGVFRLVEMSSCVGANEICYGSNIFDNPTDSGWIALCDGPCDTVACTNFIDYFEKGFPFGMPLCADFTPAGVVVTGSTASESATRIAFNGGGVAGLQSDWTVAIYSRD